MTQPGNLTNAGTITTGAVAVTIGGNLTQSGVGTSTFATTTFNGALNSTINAGLYNGVVVITKSNAPTLITIATSTTINLGNSPTSQLLNSGQGGSGAFLTNNGTILVGTGTWTINNSGNTTMGALTNNGTITSLGSGWDINYTNFVNNGTITYSGSMNIETNFNQNGTFDLTGKTVTFDGGYNTIATTTGNFGASITLAKTAATLTFANDTTVQNFTLTTGTLVNVAKTLTVNGNLVVTPAAQTYFGGALLNVVMASSTDQNITISSGTVTTPLTINKPAGKVSLLTNYTGSGAGGSITIATGTLYLNGKNLSATTTVSSGGRITNSRMGNSYHSNPGNRFNGNLRWR